MADRSMGGGFTRRVDFSPSYNFLRPTDDNYGIGAMRIRFVLIGPKGAIQWMIGTEWFIASARQHLRQFSERDIDNLRKPSGWDLGYHAREKQYDRQQSMGPCEYLDGAECFYDGSSLNADLLIEGFLAGGDEWLWPQLESYYRCRFEGADFPTFTPVYQDHPSDRKAALAKAVSP